MTVERLRAALADRYRLEWELGQGGMATGLVTEVTTRLKSLKRHVPSELGGHFSHIRRAAASAAGSRRDDGDDRA